MSDPFLGQIMQVGFNFAPYGWSTCQGQTIAISQNTALFSLLGTTFGGNGTTDFQLPNLQSRFIVGTGQAPGLSTYVAGEVGGTESVTLTTNELPAHTHPAAVTQPTATATLHAIPNVSNATAAPAAGSILSTVVDNNGQAAPVIYAPAGAPGTAVNLGGLSVSVSGAGVTIGLTGGNQPVPTRPPFLALTTIIALSGIFPTRG